MLVEKVEPMPRFADIKIELTAQEAYALKIALYAITRNIDWPKVYEMHNWEGKKDNKWCFDKLNELHAKLEVRTGPNGKVN